MNKSYQYIIAETKREFTKFHKVNFGKGPSLTSVSITENVLLIKYRDMFSPIEEVMLDLPEGIENVKRIREQILINKSSSFIDIIEKLINKNVKEIVTSLDANNGESYLFIIFYEDIAI